MFIYTYDICGHIQTSTYYGCTYFITFIDDYTRYTIVYLLHYKFKAFAKFKQFKQLVENQTNYQIKVLRVDNGGEYKLKEFTQLCQECPIQQQFTIPYTPQQNGVA